MLLCSGKRPHAAVRLVALEPLPGTACAHQHLQLSATLGGQPLQPVGAAILARGVVQEVRAGSGPALRVICAFEVRLQLCSAKRSYSASARRWSRRSIGARRTLLILWNNKQVEDRNRQGCLTCRIFVAAVRLRACGAMATAKGAERPGPERFVP
jgi:hypothetical protein